MTIYKHFGEIVKCIFTFLLKIQHDNNFLPTSKHRQAKVRRSLGICLYDCFIYCSNFVFRKCLETRHHLDSGHKTVNSQGSQGPHSHILMTGGSEGFFWVWHFGQKGFFWVYERRRDFFGSRKQQRNFFGYCIFHQLKSKIT